MKKNFYSIFVFAFLFSSSLIAGTPNILIFDDMEHGDPSNNAWFTFGGSPGGGGIGPNFTDLPPEDGGSASLETGWGSGGNPGFFGGFGRTFPLDLTGAQFFNFWINPDAGQDYILEINLQEDDDGDGGTDEEFQYNLQVGPPGAGAEVISGGGWQLVSIPLSSFFDDNSFLNGGNGVLDPVPVTNGGNGELIDIVIAVISNTGADVTFRTDFWVFSDCALNAQSIPTMNQWAYFLYGLLIFTVGIVGVYNARRLVVKRL